MAILAAWISRATLEEFFLSQTGWIMHLGAFRDSNPLRQVKREGRGERPGPDRHPIRG